MVWLPCFKPGSLWRIILSRYSILNLIWVMLNIRSPEFSFLNDGNCYFHTSSSLGNLLDLVPSVGVFSLNWTKDFQCTILQSTWIQKYHLKTVHKIIIFPLMIILWYRMLLKLKLVYRYRYQSWFMSCKLDAESFLYAAINFCVFLCCCVFGRISAIHI